VPLWSPAWPGIRRWDRDASSHEASTVPIAEITGGIILALGLIAFWRVLLPSVGVLLLVAAALGYGYTVAARHGPAPNSAPVATIEAARPAADGYWVASPEAEASARPVEGRN
jgi:hypothetical protein